MATPKYLFDLIDLHGMELKIISEEVDPNFKNVGYVTKACMGDENSTSQVKVLYVSSSWNDIKSFHNIIIKAVKASTTTTGSNLYFFAEGMADLFKFILKMKPASV